MPIRLLSEEVAAQIAAGEVVERPASVVKELIENALDAGARTILVEIEGGGRRRIRVSDDGCGIPAAEVELAVARHATSKLTSADDLFKVETLGFRGEALASIASVSRLSVTSRAAGETAGVQIAVEGGKHGPPAQFGAPQGTSINVEDLFFNVPARLKFMKSETSERRQIEALVARYAIAYPQVRFRLLQEGRQNFQSAGSGNVRDVLIDVFGVEIARRMIELEDGRGEKWDVRSERSEAGEQRSEVGSQRSESQEQRLEIGDDAASERQTLAADLLRLASQHSSASHLSPPTSQPATSDLRPPTSSIQVTGYLSPPDINRANRREITLFVNGRWVQDARLSAAIMQAYHTLLMVGRYPIAVVMVNLPPDQVDVNVHPTKAEVRFRNGDAAFSAVERAVRRTLLERAPVPEIEPRHWADGTGMWRPQTFVVGQSPISNYQLPITSNQPPVTNPDLVTTPSTDDPALSVPASEIYAPPAPIANVPLLRVIGQVGAAYVVAEGPDGLYLIDQHAAHERVLYEAFSLQRAGAEVASQALLEPMAVELPPDAASLLEGQLATLSAIGFEVEHFGGNTFLVRSLPTVLGNLDPARAVRAVVENFEEDETPLAAHVEERLIARVCKRAAVKAGQVLSTQEQIELVRRLEKCASPRTCPHGRPTMIHLSVDVLEKQFGRK